LIGDRAAHDAFVHRRRVDGIDSHNEARSYDESWKEFVHLGAEQLADPIFILAEARRGT